MFSLVVEACGFSLPEPFPVGHDIHQYITQPRMLFVTSFHTTSDAAYNFYPHHIRCFSVPALHIASSMAPPMSRDLGHSLHHDS